MLDGFSAHIGPLTKDPPPSHKHTHHQQLIQHHGEVATVHKVVRVRRYANPIEMVKEAFSRLNSLRDG